MGNTFGQQIIDQVGASVQLCADGRPVWWVGGITVDWSVVTATANPYYQEDGFFVPAGEKFLGVGQVLCREVPTNSQLVSVTGGPTGGTFTLSFVNPITGVTQVTGPIGYNASATEVQTALQALGNCGVGNVLVSGLGAEGAMLGPTGAGPTNSLLQPGQPGYSVGGPWQVTFAGVFVGQTVANMTLGTNSLTGGAGPSVTIATFTSNGIPAGASPQTFGLWGPYDPTAVDGRQLLTRQNTVLLNESWREIDVHSNHLPALVGGAIWRDRLIATPGTHSLAAGPTFTELEAVMPLIRYVVN